MPYYISMYTVIETPVYSKMVDKILTESERDSFAAFIASNPQAGSVARGSGGIRKVRWAQQGRGKSGGARIIYYNKLDNGEIWLLTIYAKGDRSTIPSHELKVIKEVIDRD
jgi:mRNA-degrading endonuclease RelE of RelBE toxin-antitoxin system